MCLPPTLRRSNGLCRTSCVSHASVHAIAAPVLGGPEVVRVIVLNKRFRSRPIDLRYRLHPRPGRGWSRSSHLNSDHHDVIWCGKSSHDGPKQRSCERCEGIGKSVRVRARARRVRAAAPARARARRSHDPQPSCEWTTFGLMMVAAPSRIPQI